MADDTEADVLEDDGWDADENEWGAADSEWFGDDVAQHGMGIYKRRRVKKKRIGGTVLEWREHFGWIRPDNPVNHEEAGMNLGRIYVHKKDVVLESAQSLKEGDQVIFLVYSDGKGLGAMDCRLRSEVVKPKAKKPKLTEEAKKITGGKTPKALNQFASDGSFLAQCLMMQEQEAEESAKKAAETSMSELGALLNAEASQDESYSPWGDSGTFAPHTQATHSGSGWAIGGFGEGGKSWRQMPEVGKGSKGGKTNFKGGCSYDGNGDGWGYSEWWTTPQKGSKGIKSAEFWAAGKGPWSMGSKSNVDGNAWSKAGFDSTADSWQSDFGTWSGMPYGGKFGSQKGYFASGEIKGESAASWGRPWGGFKGGKSWNMAAHAMQP